MCSESHSSKVGIGVETPYKDSSSSEKAKTVGIKFAKTSCVALSVFTSLAIAAGLGIAATSLLSGVGVGFGK